MPSRSEQLTVVIKLFIQWLWCAQITTQNKQSEDEKEKCEESKPIVHVKIAETSWEFYCSFSVSTQIENSFRSPQLILEISFSGSLGDQEFENLCLRKHESLRDDSDDDAEVLMMTSFSTCQSIQICAINFELIGKLSGLRTLFLLRRVLISSIIFSANHNWNLSFAAHRDRISL